MTLRGFQLTAAAVLVAELGDVRRFEHPRHLMAFLGLIPREHSTGNTRRQGSITKAGNAHARWILVEAVQHAFLPPKVSAPLALRQQDRGCPSDTVRSSGDNSPPSRQSAHFSSFSTES